MDKLKIIYYNTNIYCYQCINGVKMATKQISLRLDEELIFQIKEFAVQSRMTQTELIKLWIIRGLAESKNDSKKGSLKDLANTVTLPYETDSVEIAKNLQRREL